MIVGVTYAISWDAGEGFFHLTVSGDSRRVLLIHEQNGAGCHCKAIR